MPIEMPLPDPWIMGVVTIGAGIVFWWLTPDFVRREELSRSVWGRLSLFRRWPQGTRSLSFVASRLGAVVWIALGVIILLVAAGGGA